MASAVVGRVSTRLVGLAIKEGEGGIDPTMKVLCAVGRVKGGKKSW